MKKIISLSIILAVVIALLSSGTWAYFNDVQTVTGNTVTAGTLELTVGSGATTPISVKDAHPVVANGSNVSSKSFAVKNTGSLDGDLSILFGTVSVFHPLTFTHPAYEAGASAHTTVTSSSLPVSGSITTLPVVSTTGFPTGSGTILITNSSASLSVSYSAVADATHLTISSTDVSSIPGNNPWVIVTATNSPMPGVLDQYLKGIIWVDVDGSGTWTTGDYYLDPSGPTVVTYSSNPSFSPTTISNFYSMSQYNGKTFSGAETIPGTSTVDPNINSRQLVFNYIFPEDTATVAGITGGTYYQENQAQGDTLSFDLTLNLGQLNTGP